MRGVASAATVIKTSVVPRVAGLVVTAVVPIGLIAATGGSIIPLVVAVGLSRESIWVCVPVAFAILITDTVIVGFSPFVAISLGVTGWDSPGIPVVDGACIPRSSGVAAFALLVIGLYVRTGGVGFSSLVSNSLIAACGVVP